MLTGCADGYAITEANLPPMAPYPNEQDYIDPITGVFDDEGFDIVWDAWRGNQGLRQNLTDGYRDGITDMTRKTASVFLTNTAENAVYSPLNTYIALGMLAELTDGDGRAEILSLLGTADMETLRGRTNSLWRANYSDDGATTSVLASSLWLDKDISYKMETLETLRDTYYSSTYQGEMGTAAYDKAMQSWLNEKTGDLLKEAVGELKTNPETVLAMLSTVYYQTKWDREFREENNEERTFHGTKEDVTCTFMVQTEEQGVFYAGENFSAFRRRMEEDGEMWFILPDEGVEVDAVLTDPDMYSLVEAPSQWTEQKRLVMHQYIPQFDITQTIDMQEGLATLGIVTPLNPTEADFSPLTEMEGVYLSSIRQATRVAIDEEGVTAASFVEMMKAGAALPPEEEMDFVLDRPFVFVVTGYDQVPLFMGVVQQP